MEIQKIRLPSEYQRMLLEKERLEAVVCHYRNCMCDEYDYAEKAQAIQDLLKLYEQIDNVTVAN